MGRVLQHYYIVGHGKTQPHWKTQERMEGNNKADLARGNYACLHEGWVTEIILERHEIRHIELIHFYFE